MTLIIESFVIAGLLFLFLHVGSNLVPQPRPAEEGWVSLVVFLIMWVLTYIALSPAINIPGI